MSTKVTIEVGLMIVLVMTGFVMTVSQTVSALPISEETIKEGLNIVILEFQLKAAQEKLLIGGSEEQARIWVQTSELLGTPEVQEKIITMITEGTSEEETREEVMTYITKLYLTIKIRTEFGSEGFTLFQ